MSTWSDEMEQRFAELETAVAELSRRQSSEEYPARSRLEDGKLLQRIRSGKRRTINAPFNLFDDVGAAATAQSYTDTQVAAKARTIMLWSATDKPAAGPSYMMPGFATSNATEYRWPLPASTVSTLRVFAGTPPGVGETVALTIRKNTSSTTVTVQLSGATNTGADTTHSVSFSAGDLVSILITQSAGSVAEAIFVSFEVALA